MIETLTGLLGCLPGEWAEYAFMRQALLAIILIAHSDVKNFKNPLGTDYDRFQMRLHAKAAAIISDWCDDVLFANLDVQLEKVGKGKAARAKAVGGVRRVFTSRAPAYEAKNRHSLPTSLALDFAEYAAAVDKAQPTDQAVVRAAIETLIEGVGDPVVTERARKAMAGKPDAATLVRMRDWLSAKLDEKAQHAQDALDAAGEEVPAPADGAGEAAEPGSGG